MDTHDTLKRRKRFTVEPTGKNVRPTDFDTPLFLALQRHGFLPTNYMHQYHGTNSYKYTQRRLGELVNELHPEMKAQMLHRPQGQRATEFGNNKKAVYALTPAGIKWLKQAELHEDTIRPSGPFVHQLMISTVTASIELAAKKKGIEFIPGHVILERANTTLGHMVGKSKLIPDQLFALKYPNEMFRSFILECDRGTEPITTNTVRKSYQRNLEQYKMFVGQKQYQKFYGLKSGLKVLNVMNNPTRMAAYMSLIDFKCHYMLFQTIDNFGAVFTPPPLMPQLLKEPWERVGYDPLNISEI
jgi:hypothetical protein